MNIEKLKFPIGKFQAPEEYTSEILIDCINEIAVFPENIRKETLHLTENQLNTRYRPDGWTIRQVVNHCADSHINSFMRFKLTLTEEKPIIKPYREDLWAELSDSKNIEIEPALDILNGIHK